jgi:acetoin utilization deacetylase AcuC-like enzyme
MSGQAAVGDGAGVPVALITHDACLEHDTGPWHPECPDRLRAVLKALAAPPFSALHRIAAPAASIEHLARVHPDRHIAAILDLAPAPGETIALDPDTMVSAGSREAALRAAGGAVAGVDAVMGGEVRRAFVAVRPPGHHAERDRAMGFCLFSNAAIAARHAQARWGAGRVAVVDFDVHHGNGTQDICAPDPSLFYASSHQFPCYPGTGRAAERGVAGNVVNVPLPPGAGSVAFRAAWSGTILPALDRFAPALLIVSAGFDAHLADPLAQLRLETEDFGWITGALVRLAARHCQGRVVSVLEGGYDLDALAASAAVHVHALLQP